jgi:hydrogenase expression/formation protein HypC
MCLAIPGEVIEVGVGRPELARVEVCGVRRTVSVGLLATAPVPGDWVLIHVGFALSVIDEAEARATLALLEELGQAYEDELAAMAGSTIE